MCDIEKMSLDITLNVVVPLVYTHLNAEDDLRNNETSYRPLSYRI